MASRRWENTSRHSNYGYGNHSPPSQNTSYFSRSYNDRQHYASRADHNNSMTQKDLKIERAKNRALQLEMELLKSRADHNNSMTQKDLKIERAKNRALQLEMELLKLAYMPLTNAKLIGAYVIPHGGIALTPSDFNPPSKLAKEWAWKIHRAAVQIGHHVRDMQPDLILLSTPHGAAGLNNFQFYVNSKGSGSAETDNCVCPPCCFTVDATMDAARSRGVVKTLSQMGLNVSGLSFFGPDAPAPLRWGEVIPLSFVRDIDNMKVIVMSHPERRYDQSVSMIPELRVLGAALYHQMNNLPERVIVIISSDLAHTHQASGPYGYSPEAEPFDKACGNWAKTLHPDYLLKEAAHYADKAKSCGFTGLAMLHGMLEESKLSSWTPTMLANYHPSYYGMMVASFLPASHPY